MLRGNRQAVIEGDAFGAARAETGVAREQERAPYSKPGREAEYRDDANEQGPLQKFSGPLCEAF